MVDPDWSGAVSFGHSACLNPGITMTPCGSQGTRREPSGIRRPVATSDGVEVSALTARVSGQLGSDRRHRPLLLLLKANVVIRDPGNPAAGLNLGGCGVDDTVARRTVRLADNPSPRKRRSCSLVRQACCPRRGDLSGHQKSMTAACPGAHLVFGPSRLGDARPSG
jgi:hypothetical protein